MTEGDAPVVAAGAVVWRERGGGPEVLLVHRPRYDDWSFPKGKPDPGEHLTSTAIREVSEETGIEVVLGVPLPVVRYRLPNETPKAVSYWSAAPIAGIGSEEPPFVAGPETDDRVWLPFEQARDRLTHRRDRELLDQVTPTPTSPLVLLRHATALARTDWAGADPARPLTTSGRAQAARLVPILAAYGIARVVSSPAVRCMDTVRPYATHRDLTIEVEPAFAEAVLAQGGDPLEPPQEIFAVQTKRRARALRSDPASTVWCSHRPTLPAIAEALDVPHTPLEVAELRVLHRPLVRSSPGLAPDRGGYAAIERHGLPTPPPQ